MSRKTLVFLALAITMLYGAGFAIIGDGARTGHAAVGGVVVALMWMATGMFGRPEGEQPPPTAPADRTEDRL